MKRKTYLKTGDAVPVEHDLYYVVEKTFVKSDSTDEDEDYSFYQVGEPIVINAKRLESYVPSFKDFLSNNCRVATDEEIRSIYNEKYSNASVGNVYDDGSYEIRHFFIVESNLDKLLEEFDMDRDNCYWGLRLEMIDLICELCGLSYIGNIAIGNYNGMIFLFTRDENHKPLLNISRKATPEETAQLGKYVFQVQEEYRKKYEEERLKEKEAKAKIYELHKSNPEYFPGAGGNYKQILMEEGKKVVPEKEYSLEQIKIFYNTLLNFEGLSDEVKNSIIFYGGTISYILCNECGKTRKFGDIDIFLPVSMMQRLRYELRDELNYIYDSMELSRRIRLTAKGFRVKTPNLWWDDEGESYEEYCRREHLQRLAKKEAEKEATYQDYGFKAVLFGINISVFPLYDWTFEDGSIGVCAKSFRLSKEEGDWNFLLNTIVSKGITINDFCNDVSIFGHNARTVKTEYTIASKRNAIRFGYILRKDTDEADLKFIEAHKSELGVDKSQIEFFMNNIPDYGISHVYRITRGYDASIISPEAYKHVVTRTDKPS